MSLFLLIRHRGIQVLILSALYLLAAPYVSSSFDQGLYAVSVLIKDLLLWILPVTILLFIAHTICSFESRAPLFVLALLLFEAISNFSSVWYSYGAGQIASHFLPQIELPTLGSDLTPLWRLPWLKPQWWSADKGTFLGLLIGFGIVFTRQERLKERIEQAKEKAQWILTKVFSRLIPLFVLGFVARMHQTEILHHLIAHYALLLLFLVLFLCVYLFFLAFLASDGNLLSTIKNILPAGAIAFTSGCSLSTMPWTIQGAAKNLKNPQLAKAIIPATTNIQQIGDCIANTFICFLIYSHFFGHSPSFLTWFLFSLVFVLARYATAAVMGGAIFFMLPIYESYLGFNPEMIAIILAFNVVLDPLITSSNVLANGILCRVFEKVWIKLLNLNPFQEEKN